MITNDKYVFFWDGIYSNWYHSPFEYKGKTFQNSEQAFMWEKALYFNDKEISDEILKTPNPSQNKGLGRKVKNFNVDKWMEVSFNIICEVNIEKFNQHRLYNIQK